MLLLLLYFVNLKLSLSTLNLRKSDKKTQITITWDRYKYIFITGEAS